MQKNFLRSLVVAAVLASPGFAFAADVAPRAYTKAPIADPVYDWSGLYVGASVGGRWDESVWTTTSLGFPGAPAQIPAAAGNNPMNFKSASGRYGGYLGYNWQFAPRWVVGIEGDYAWANNKSQFIGSIPGTAVPNAFITGDNVTRKDKWDAGVRARLGYLVTPTTLLFGTAGASWMATESTVACGTPQLWCTGTNNTTQRVDTVRKTVVGWSVGGGIEWMLAANWLLRGEYRYTSYEGLNGRFLAGAARYSVRTFSTPTSAPIKRTRRCLVLPTSSAARSLRNTDFRLILLQ